jgi:hypothetical protein
MTAIADTDTASNGGSAILSYSLEWDSGNSGSGFQAIVGDPTNSLLLEHVVTGLTAGTAYTFRYRVRNVYGWSIGGYSQELTAIAAVVPSAPAQPTTTNDGVSARI